jgi:glucose-1-phosphate adenylyltransferase
VEVRAEEASQYGILQLSPAGRIERFIEKPETLEALPDGDRVLGSMGIYVFNRAFLARTLHQDAFSSRSSHDFGKDILPALLNQARVYAYTFSKEGSDDPAYWRDVGTPAAYWQAHLELLDDDPGLRLDDTTWPLRHTGKAPALTQRYARPDADPRGRSIVAGECVVDGILDRSVLFNSVRIAGGSVIESSVLLPGATIGRNCRLSGVIVDSHCHVPDDTIIDARAAGDSSDRSAEPTVVTAGDFAPVAIHACA